MINLETTLTVSKKMSVCYSFWCSNAAYWYGGALMLGETVGLYYFGELMVFSNIALISPSSQGIGKVIETWLIGLFSAAIIALSIMLLIWICIQMYSCRHVIIDDSRMSPSPSIQYHPDIKYIAASAPPPST